MFQFNAINAFLNARLLRKIYYCTLEEFTDELRELLELQYALYSLKEALLLQYQKLLSTLKKLSLKLVLEALYLYTNNYLIIFFYIDNIIILVYLLNRSYYQIFKQQLLTIYEICKLDKLKQFLSIYVIYKELSYSIYLTQDLFINKITVKFNLKLSIRYLDVPLRDNVLLLLIEKLSAA